MNAKLRNFSVVLLAVVCLSGCAGLVTKPSGSSEFIVNTNSPVVQAIEAARQVNAATPTPWQPLVATALTAVLAGFGAYAQHLNLKKKTQIEQMIESIEDLPDGPAKQEVKNRIAKGTSTLNPIVERVTE